MPYDVTQINDTKLLVWAIAFSLVLIFTIIVGVVACFVFYSKEHVANAKRIKALRERAATDPVAEKRLRKMERKLKKNVKKERAEKILVFALVLILVFANLFICVIPGWLDYIHKDYVVYDGAFSVERNVYVHRYTRTSAITLDDGTVLTGSLGLDEGQHHKRIVYSKRTEIALWIEE